MALTQDLLDHLGLHARRLQLREGLAGIDRVELIFVAGQNHAGNTERVGDPEQIKGLDGEGDRALRQGLASERRRSRRASTYCGLVLRRSGRRNPIMLLYFGNVEDER